MLTNDTELKGDQGAHGREKSLPDLTGKCVLVVGDEDEVRDVLYEMIVLWGGECHEAETTPQALECIENLASLEKSFDLVLIDLNSCGARGLAMAQKLTHHPSLETTHILFLNGEPCPSSHVGTGIAQAFCVEKPVKVVELQEVIAKVLCGETAGFPRRSKNRPPTGRAACPQRLLLVEDNPVNSKAIRTLLEKRGHQVALAENGSLALEILNRESFDLILMDLVMPEMDGIAATQAIRQGECAMCDPDIPILAITAHMENCQKQRFLDAGGTNYMTKPFHVPDLLAVVENFARKGA